MELSEESSESSELDGPPLRRRSPPQKHQKIEEKTRLQKNMFFLKNYPKVSLKVDPKIVKNCIPASFLRNRKNTKFCKRFFSCFYCFRDARDVENLQFSLQIQAFSRCDPFSKITPFFTKLCQKWSLRRPLKPLEISKN